MKKKFKHFSNATNTKEGTDGQKSWKNKTYCDIGVCIGKTSRLIPYQRRLISGCLSDWMRLLFWFCHLNLFSSLTQVWGISWQNLTKQTKLGRDTAPLRFSPFDCFSHKNLIGNSSPESIIHSDSSNNNKNNSIITNSGVINESIPNFSWIFNSSETENLSERKIKELTVFCLISIVWKKNKN